MKVYILLDRSGSMGDKWVETLGALNGYVEDLAKKDTDAGVTLATFDKPDASMAFDVIRRDVAPKDWKPVTTTEASPRGWTPLYDAFGKIVAMADEDASEKAIFVVITDGLENTSTELDKAAVNALLARCRAKGWEDVFLGADFDTSQQSASMGTPPGRSMNMKAGSYRSATACLAEATQSYAGGQSIGFSDEDRKRAAGDDTP